MFMMSEVDLRETLRSWKSGTVFSEEKDLTFINLPNKVDVNALFESPEQQMF